MSSVYFLIISVVVFLRSICNGNVLTIRNGNQITCVVSGDNWLDSALYLDPPINIKNENTTINEYKLKWHDTKAWEVDSSINSPFGPVTDKRWEYFPQVLGNSINFKYVKKAMMPFSVCTTNNELQLILLQNKIQIFEKFIRLNSNSDTNASPCIWKHYAISINNKQLEIYEKDAIISNTTLNDSELGTEIKIKTNNDSYWKKHEYNYFQKYIKGRLDIDIQNNSIAAIVSVSGISCISLYVAVNENSFLKLQLKSKSNEDEQEIKGGPENEQQKPFQKIRWQKIQLNVDSSEDATLTIRRGSYNKYGSRFWAIDADRVLPCAMNYGVRYFEIEPSEYGEIKTVCKELRISNSSNKAAKDQFDFPKPGYLSANITCEDILKTKFCENRTFFKDGLDSGFCAWGYKGPSCTEVCDSGHFGLNCANSCSENCTTCDRIKGCTECVNGYFGTTCKQSLKIIETTSTSILLQWDKPEENVIGQFIIEYQMQNKLLCKSKENLQKKEKRRVPGIRKDVKLSNLEPFANYSINITFATKSKNFTISKYVQTTFHHEISSKEFPSNILFLKNNSISISLPECDKFDGKLNITLSLKCVDMWCNGTIVHLKTIEINRKSFKKQIPIMIDEKLMDYTDYQLEIAIMSSNRRILEYAKLQDLFKTIKTPPGAPDPVENLEITEHNSTFVRIKWKPPTRPKGQIQNYFIKILNNNTLMKTLNCTPKCTADECSELVTNLTDNTKYNISVLVKNEGVDETETSAKIIVVTTDQKVPKAPKNINIFWNNGSKSFKISWKYENSSNTPIHEFHIRIVNDAETQTDIYERSITSYKYEINVKPFSKYNLTIDAKNKHEGEKAFVQVRTFPPIPQLTSDIPLIEICKLNEPCLLRVLEPIENTYFYLTREDRDDLKCLQSINKSNKWTISDDENNNDNKSYNVHDDSNGVNISFSLNGKRYCTSSMLYPPLKENGRGLLIGIIISTALVSILIIFGYLIYAFKYFKFPFNRNTGKKTTNISLQKISTVRRKTPVGNSNEEENSNLLGRFNIKANIHNLEQSNPIKVNDLEDYLIKCLGKDRSDIELIKQHNAIPIFFKENTTQIGMLPENKKKNRYADQIPYDKNRVVLQNNGDNGDYINASYIDGYKAPKAFIATQAPKIKTISDFWLMICEQRVSMILMLTQLVENGSAKATQYWPNEGLSAKYGEVTVRNIEDQIYSDYIERMLQVTYNNHRRTVKHLQFISWPDHGVPLYAQSLLPVMEKLLAERQDTPIVVHCSAGCGRTGTIILCDIAARMAKREGKIDFVKILFNMRKQRGKMVNSADQYIFAHLLVLEYLRGKNFAILVTENFQKSIEDAQVESNIKEVIEELEKVNNFYHKTQPMSTLHLTDEEKLKNRFHDILPGNKRTYLIPHRGSNYVNAVYVDCYKSQNKFIVTQQPLNNTVEDFWRLVMEQDVNAIISLNEIDEKDQNCKIFWPQFGKINFGNITLEATQKDDFDGYEIYKIKAETPKDSGKLLNLICLKNWPRQTLLPQNMEDLISIWKELLSTSWKGDSPIIVTCYDGCTASGLFVSLAFLLEKLNLEQSCDVFTAVRIIKQSRSEFMKDPIQLKFLYKAAALYIDAFQNYNNFA